MCSHFSVRSEQQGSKQVQTRHENSQRMHRNCAHTEEICEKLFGVFKNYFFVFLYATQSTWSMQILFKNAFTKNFQSFYCKFGEKTMAMYPSIFKLHFKKHYVLPVIAYPLTVISPRFPSEVVGRDPHTAYLGACLGAGGRLNLKKIIQ